LLVYAQIYLSGRYSEPRLVWYYEKTLMSFNICCAIKSSVPYNAYVIDDICY